MSKTTKARIMKSGAAKGADAVEKMRRAAVASIQARLDGEAEVQPKAKAAKQPKAATPTTKQPKPAKEKKPKPTRLSALDAAAKVLAESKEPMNAKSLVETMAAKGLWKSPNGRTPDATLSAAIQREIAKRGRDSRFKRVDRGLFIATGKGA